MSVDPTRLADDLICKALSGVCGGRVYPDLADPAAAMPYIVYSLQSGTDHNTKKARHSHTLQYLVRSICEGMSYYPLFPIMDQIDEAMQSVGKTKSVKSVRRIREVRYPTNEDGKIYRHFGYIYEIILTAD